MIYAVQVLRGVDDTPLGELGFGVVFRDAFEDQGGRTEAWEWVYGGAARDAFPPHVALDASTRETPDGWDTQASFPGFGFWFPADHKGCLCDVVPVMIPPPADRDRRTPDVGLLDLLRETVRDFLDENPDRSTRGVTQIGVQL